MSGLRDIDIVLSQEPRLRKKLRPSDVAWNKNKKAFEYWNGAEWQIVASVGGGGDSSCNCPPDSLTKADLEAHKADPQAHPLVTSDNPGFSSVSDKEKLAKLEVTLDPDPTLVFMSILGDN